MHKLSIEDLELQGKKVLMRVDFNVPIRDGRVDNDKRIVAALPSLRYALDHGASLILISHLGRPEGRVLPELSLRPVVSCLERHLGRPVAFAEDCVGAVAEEAASQIRPGDVLLLENLRFHPGEQKPADEPDFAERLARLGDCYVNDAFGTAHRAHASMVGVAQKFDRRAAGLLMAKEIDYFGRALSAPRRPLLTLLGGAKVSDKIAVLENLLEKIDTLLIGGAMAYTFLAARKVDVGASKVEQDSLEPAAEILERAAAKGLELLLPLDLVCGDEFSETARQRVTEDASIPAGWIGLDIGPRTLAAFCGKIREAGTVIWNGPVGVFEWEQFAAGTMGLARACAESEALTIVGGGDSASAAKKSGLVDRFSHISTGGGASLELLEGKELPGLAVLTDR